MIAWQVPPLVLIIECNPPAVNADVSAAASFSEATVGFGSPAPLDTGWSTACGFLPGTTKQSAA